MEREHLAVVAAGLTILCVVPYLRDIRRGTTRPHRTSWLVFAALAVVAAASQALDDAGSGALLAAGAALGFGAVFVASIRHGVGGWSVADRVALAIGTIGVLLSVATSRPLVAVGAVIVAELGAVALTARKALVDPRSETRSTWVIDGLAGILAIVAVRHWTVAELLYPVHHAAANATIAVAITVGGRRRVASDTAARR